MSAPAARRGSGPRLPGWSTWLDRPAFLFQGPPVTQNDADDPTRSKVVGQVEAAEWLPAESGASQATLTLPKAFAIPKTAKNEEAAWQYIRYVISPERDRERAEKLGSLPRHRKRVP